MFINKSKVKITIKIVAVIVLFASIFSLITIRSFVDKEQNLVKMTKDNDQDIFILGTIHDYHFNKILGYSLQDIRNVIEHVNPDLILIEARQESIKEFDTIDGPIEMTYVYAYALEMDIDIEGIDWFELSEDRRANKTDTKRDDKIYENIIERLGHEKTVLVICGARHRKEQVSRFLKDGYEEATIENIETYSVANNKSEFLYPELMVSEVEKQINYWDNISIEEITRLTQVKGKAYRYWLEISASNRDSYSEILDMLISENKLYW